MYNINTFIIMKSFLNYSKLAIATLITSSVFVACSDEITETECDTPYVVNSGSIRSAGEAVDMRLPSGTKWANKNIGATSESDNGILFVWGDVTGNQLLANSATSYTDVTDKTSTSVLFNQYKAAEEKKGFLYDTTNVYKEDIAPLIGSLDYWSKDSITINSKKTTRFDTLVVNRLNKIAPDYKGRRLDTQFSKVDDSGYEVVINLIDSVEVKFFESVTKSGDDDKEDVYKYKTYAGSEVKGAPIYSIVADANHDPATANWGEGWRMPTAQQLQELIDNCTWEFTGNGYKVTSKPDEKGNTNSIFLPAAGYRYGEKLYGNGNAGYYASGEIVGIYKFPSMSAQKDGNKGEITANEDMPNMLIFQHGQFANSVKVFNNLSTSYGISIRPVTK